jgi:hypothetical protein
MDFNDQRLWYGALGVIVALLVIAYLEGWFGGTPTPLTPAPMPTTPPAPAPQ